MRIAHVAAYLLASGRTMLSEPMEYGPFRLLDGARRALALLEGDDETYARFASIHDRIQEVFQTVRLDIDLPTLLDELCLEMAAGMREWERADERPPQ
ncbi:hypothetical protein D5H75_37815 [Bailinhaonella thermotolerans]|uniref:Uncharacterized protein n=1 Tax=Bailinhaonella thermotolerans TaxID=1070861 RepID=A0A3A4A687_9ACTN|nr:hypothetical protein D5H75_37815 [Bailinhaonella thermotolerans]